MQRKTRIRVLVLIALTPTLALHAAEPLRAAKTSKEWLKNNLEDKDVVQTKSGLQYKVLRTTQGCFPDAREPVMLHYEASLAADSSVVDSSYQGPARVFSLQKMIKAWKEGIPMMRQGEMWQFYVPPKLAYGSSGLPPLVGPDSVLIFRVELLKAGRCK